MSARVREVGQSVDPVDDARMGGACLRVQAEESKLRMLKSLAAFLSLGTLIGAAVGLRRKE